MNHNSIFFGQNPFETILVHGGPGAIGSLNQLAKQIASYESNINPVFDQTSISQQLNHLYQIIKSKANPPVNLIGHSWGAWLVCLFAAKYPELIKKVIIIGSGPFKENEAMQIESIRLKRMNELQIKKYKTLLRKLQNSGDKNQIFNQLGNLISTIDSYQLIENVEFGNHASLQVYQSVWPEAAQLRKHKLLLKICSQMPQPLVAIHGYYDPHPYEAIKNTFNKKDNFKFILLKKCGHYPWYEKHARKKFMNILKKELE